MEKEEFAKLSIEEVAEAVKRDEIKQKALFPSMPHSIDEAREHQEVLHGAMCTEHEHSCFYRDGKIALDKNGCCNGCGIHNTTLKYNAQNEKDKAPAEQPKEAPTINDMLFTIMSNQLIMLKYMGYNVQRHTGTPGLKESASMYKFIEEMESNTLDILERLEK